MLPCAFSRDIVLFSVASRYSLRLIPTVSDSLIHLVVLSLGLGCSGCLVNLKVTFSETNQSLTTGTIFSFMSSLWRVE